MSEIKINISDDLANKYGKDYVKILTDFIKRAGKDKTGNLVNSLAYDIKKAGQEIQIILEGEDYLEYVSDGRNPGSFPPIQAIEDWTSLVGIPSYAAFPIAYNIFKYGIEPTNILTDAIMSIEEIGAEMLEDDLAIQLEDKIVDEINKIKIDE